jgi:RNA polymerase sigma-70 factor (ECF subfamily)
MDSSESTFEQLLKAYEGKVSRLCYAMLGNRALAEETSQEVFLRIWRALGAFRGEASLSTWVYTITRNACLTAIERMKAAATESLADPDIFRRVQARELERARREPRTDVLAWLADLPESQRQALTLFYLEERSYKEVAAALGAPMGTVKTWICRGRRALVERRLQAEVLEKSRSGT